MKTTAERQIAIKQALQRANKAMEANKIVLSNLQKLTK